MKLSEVIARVDDIKPNAFDNATKTMWINEVEGYVQTEVFLLDVEDIVEYSWSADQSTELLVVPPHCKLYWTYLSAMIDFANGEYNKYQNTMQMYNAFMGEYMRWYALNYHPADGEAIEHGYYISAYGIAVKHGFVGTEEEWLAALRGERGDSPELQYDDDKLQWKYSEEETWRDLLDITELRTDVENDTIAQVEAAKTAAQGYASNASASATEAASSASAAAGSAAEASASAAEAASSASEASGYASATAGYVTDAQGYAAAAASSASTAQSAASTAAAEVRTEMQGYVSDAQGYASSASDSAASASGSASTATTKAGEATTSATAAASSASAASTSAANASSSASAAASAASTAASETATEIRTEMQEYADSASESAEDSEAWSVGQRGGVDVPSTDETYHNNSKYWAEQAAQAAGGGVTSFNGRGGAVEPQSGDYTAAMVGADSAGSASAVQTNLDTHTGNTAIHVTASDKSAWNAKQDAIPANTYDAYGAASAVQSNLQTQIDAITSQSDVVDVVGTYAELQAYSKPTYVDDIVKVLVDSTHSNAIAYYRCAAISGTAPGTPTSWTYIGGQGPFYTKSETDTLLNGKQNTIPANTYDAYGAASSAVSTHNSSSGAHSSLLAGKVDKTSGSSAFTMGRDSNGIYVDY